MAMLKQIKVTESVKAELDSLKAKEETYNNVIANLIKENAKLKYFFQKKFFLFQELLFSSWLNFIKFY